MHSRSAQWIGLAIYVSLASLVFFWIFGGNPRRAWIRMCLSLTLSISLYLLAVWSLPYSSIIDPIAGFWGLKILLGLAVFAAGIILHVLRESNQVRYGKAEILFGIISGISFSNNLLARERSWPTLIGLAGAVYVIVRGFNN